MGTLAKSAIELPHCKSVSAWALRFENKQAGKIIAHYSDNPAGSVVTVSVYVFSGPLNVTHGHMTGRAGGYGYDKTSAAFSDALQRATVEQDATTHDTLTVPGVKGTRVDKYLGMPEVDGRGMETVRAWLETLGYEVQQVL